MSALYPYAATTGMALDVIVIVPSSSPRRRSLLMDAQSPPPVARSHPPSPARGVMASSDFFVSFPSSMAWSRASPSKLSRNPAKKSLHFLKSSLSRSISGGNKEYAEEGLEEESDQNVPDALSERGAVYTDTEPHTKLLAQRQPQPRGKVESSLLHLENPDHSQQQQLQAQSRFGSTGKDGQNFDLSQSSRKGNVQLEINGRHIPQLDMMFSAKGSATSDSEPRCRFVNGNGLRPSTEALNKLIENNGVDEGDLLDGKITEHTDSYEPTRNNEHDLSSQHNKQSIKPTSSQRESILKYGRNLLRYSLFSKGGIIIARAEAHLYLWKSSDSVIVSDVDGTVTKSDVRGVIDTVVQDKFEYCHNGICKFYNEILDGNSDKNENFGEEKGMKISEGGGSHQLTQPRSTNGKDGEIRFLYLSSRPISLVNQTRKLLLSLSQTSPSKKVYGLPPGPIMCHTGPLSSVLYAELWAKNIYEFKADVLARQVVLPFVAARGEERKSFHKASSDSCIKSASVRNFSINEEGDLANHGDRDSGRSWSGLSDASQVWDDRLLLAGFGNKATDAIAYEMAGVDRCDIYIVDKESRILCMGVDKGSPVEETSDRNTPSSSSAPANLSCDQSEWLSEVCCPGVEAADLSELAAPIRMNSTSPKARKEVASTIHSIELSLSGEGHPETSENHMRSKTDVNIFVTTEPKQTKKSSSKKSKMKQSIRAFTSMKKSSTTKFPSLGSFSSKENLPPKKIYEGYSDPLLITRVHERTIR